MESKECAREVLDEDIQALVICIIEDGIGQECFRTLNTIARDILIKTISEELRNQKYEPAFTNLISGKSK